MTNCAIDVVALWLAWSNKSIRLSSYLNITIMGGVIVAHILSDFYGRDILSEDMPKTVLGSELAVFAAVVPILFAAKAARPSRVYRHVRMLLLTDNLALLPAQPRSRVTA